MANTSEFGLILDAAVDALQAIDGTGDYHTDLADRVYPGFTREITRTKAGNNSYLEVQQGPRGVERRPNPGGGDSLLGSGGLIYAAGATLWVRAVVKGRKGVETGTEEAARLLEQDIVAALGVDIMLPHPDNGDFTTYWCRWNRTSTIGFWTDVDGVQVFFCEFDIYYAREGV